MAFHFYTERRLVSLTGRRARTLDELQAHLREVPGSSVFYHTHHQYLSHHFERPAYYSDFADWTSRALQEHEIAEKLAAIDLLSFTTIRELREAILATLENHLAAGGRPRRECPPGDEFHFCKSMSFIMPTGIVAVDLPDFAAKLSLVTHESLSFHFFEARLRLERATNDFSRWLADSGHRAAAAAIDKLDPYVLTLDELRFEIAEICYQARQR